jgi:hypothetical protein
MILVLVIWGFDDGEREIGHSGSIVLHIDLQIYILIGD